MEKIKITRVRNGKVQIFDRKVKETNYDGHLNIRLSSETKELLIKFAKENNYKSYSELVKELIEDLLQKNGYKE